VGRISGRYKQAVPCYFVLILLALLLPSAPAVAQTNPEPAIIAVVNDEAISSFDLRARTRLALLSAGVAENTESLEFYSRQTLRQMVDEIIQGGEARKLGLTVTDDEVQSAIADLEAQNKMQPGMLRKILTSKDVPYKALEQQVRASILWGRLVRRQYAGRITISADEILEVKERLRRNQGQQEYAVAEIVLRLDDKDKAASRRARELADRLYSDLRSGADFRALAREFSASSSAASGGDLGFVTLATMGTIRAAALQSMQPGQITTPIVDGDSVVLLWLKARRTAGVSEEAANVPEATASADTELSLFQTVFELPPEPSQKQLASLRDRALDTLSQISSCADAEKLAAKRKDVVSGSLGRLQLGKLPQQVRQAAAPLPIGASTPPLLVNGLLVIFTVCDRFTPGGAAAAPVKAEASLPSDEQIRERLRQQKLERLSDSFMKDLRRNSFIDLKQAGIGG
jgi:peptidyl-prolyl cis-trans isomerase SurA